MQAFVVILLGQYYLTFDLLPAPPNENVKLPCKPQHCTRNPEVGSRALAFLETPRGWGALKCRQQPRPLSCFLLELTSETLPFLASRRGSGTNDWMPMHPMQPHAGGEGRAKEGGRQPSKAPAARPPTRLKCISKPEQ